ncbi:hypothetical protein [Pectobacterium carotovorum]|uniref:hypothetical protein n=1 Tax=Pectobacterium carotovorum TaxID=554 RepID=UPI0038246428
MIIKIENPPSEISESEDFLIATDHLLKAFGEAKHILIAPKKFFELVINSNKFNSISKRYAEEARRSQIEYGNLVTYTEFHLIVDFKKKSECSWDEVGNKKTLRVPISFFIDSKSIQKPSVLCENPNDADFYFIIANHYRKNKKLNLQLAYDAINGGGGTTRNIFDRKIENKDLTLCILDSDKKHPKHTGGDTCKQFSKIKNKETGMVKVIDVHEVESLIPLDIIRDAIAKDGMSKEKEAGIGFFEKIVKKDATSKYYFDHKNGIDIKKAFELDKKYGDYWIPLIRKVTDLKSKECLQLDNCSCKVSCLKFEGFGDNILRKAIDHIKYGNLNQFTPKLEPGMMIMWDDIGQLFFSWCCAPVKKTRL